ncbi:MAG: glycine--tRNA ligase subunit beta [Candidatus Gastranaerophilales bacterium]|nr:glycine--tRNA ligase subunit beta [Candidatus Gastranaerophilales bacterium]
MNKYLLEIGTEELPYKFIPQAVEQLKAGFENFLQSNKIDFKSLEVYATPRRLAVLINDLAQKQPDEEKIVKGPIKKVAYDEDGNLTQAGKGFLQKNKVSEKDAYLENNYLHAKVFTKGKLTADLLQENVVQIVFKLQGPYFMRWGVNEQKFSRPIRWVVSILDDKEIPLDILGVKSSKFTKGHRFSDAKTEIKNPDEYIEKLKKVHVYVNQDERKSLIIQLAKKEADKLGVEVSYDEDLLDEVTYLCEYPVPVVCDFDKKYLDIPEKVTVTVMAKHQRYFALYKDEKLINKFITIANYVGDDFSNIKAGNERVIVARLDDAIFFFKEDTKKPFEKYVEALKGVTFQKGMGSVYDKTQRVINLSKVIASELKVTSDYIERTALLCKADLTTSLVFEFTELQGFIGADYAKLSGENEKVVQGIKEHYFPLNADSELAKGIEGQVVGIADKLDTICAVFVGGKIPSGSSDPLGVRRAALGIIKTVLEKDLCINLSELIRKTLDLLPQKADVLKQAEEFFVQRLIIFLSDNYRKDVLEACSANKNPLEDLCDFVKRVQLVSELLTIPDFFPVLESINRIIRILKEDVDAEIDEKLLIIDAEKKLFAGINSINEDSYKTLFESFVLINPLVEKFFEDVLVMDKDEKIKQNRLAMLGVLKKKYEKIASFNALQI